MANFLTDIGWNEKNDLVIPVRVSPIFPLYLAGVNHRYNINKWRKIGIEKPDGRPLKPSNAIASLVLPTGESQPAYLVYADNFKVIHHWNRSLFFVLAVGILANEIHG